MSPHAQFEIASLWLAALAVLGVSFAVPKWLRAPMMLISFGLAVYGTAALWSSSPEVKKKAIELVGPLVSASPTVPQASAMPKQTPPLAAQPSINAVLLPTPTKIEILPGEWFAEDPQRRIWDPRDCGYINEVGQWQIPPEWDRAYSFSEGLALVRHTADEGLYYIDTGGRFALKTTSPMHGGDFAEGLAPAKDLVSHAWGYMDRSGRYAIPATYFLTYEFSEGLGRVQLDEEHYGFVNRGGELIISARWSNAGTFSEKLAPVSRGKKWGYIDAKSNVVIPLQWSNAGPFSENVATVRDGSECSLINKIGTVVTKTHFDQIDPFSNGFALARREGKYGFVDKTGNGVTPFEWDEVIRDDRQGPARRIYWNLAKRSAAGTAIAVWIDPDLKEIWRAQLPLIEDKK